MPLNLFYTMVQKSQKWPKTQIKGGSCLKSFHQTFFDWIWWRSKNYGFLQTTPCWHKEITDPRQHVMACLTPGSSIMYMAERSVAKCPYLSVFLRKFDL